MMRGSIVTAIVIALIYGARIDGISVINSCCDLATKGCSSYFSISSSKPGVYQIKDCCAVGSVILGYCDTFTDGGGWLVIQRRQKNVGENFDRVWLDYETGFGNLNSEFWYGLGSLHCLTSKGQWELRIDLTFTNGTSTYLHYNSFKVGPSTDNYQLSISGFTGIIPTDPIIASSEPLNGQQFTTRDRDNDQLVDGNCAARVYQGAESGGWWYNSCYRFNPNINDYGGINNYMIFLDGVWYSPDFIEMKIRPISNCGR